MIAVPKIPHMGRTLFFYRSDGPDSVRIKPILAWNPSYLEKNLSVRFKAAKKEKENIITRESLSYLDGLSFKSTQLHNNFYTPTCFLGSWVPVCLIQDSGWSSTPGDTSRTCTRAWSGPPPATTATRFIRTATL
jgi:hypothetical protein